MRKAFESLSRPRKRGQPRGFLMRLRRDMAARPQSPGGPVCAGEEGGARAAWTSTRCSRRLHFRCRAGNRKRLGASAQAQKEPLSGYIREIPRPARSLASIITFPLASSDVIPPRERGVITVCGELRSTVFPSTSPSLSLSISPARGSSCPDPNRPRAVGEIT